MGLSWSFSFSSTALNKNDFQIVEKKLKEFFNIYGLKYDEIVSCGETEIECFDVDVYARSDFDESSILFLKNNLWKKGFIPFEYGVQVQESVPMSYFSEHEYQENLLT